MVLGLRSKNKKGASIQVDFTIHIQEIKPWPPSQSLKSIRSVVLQWENGDRNSGSMSPVAPLLTEGKIEFNDSFKLQATFSKDPSVKGNDTIAFQKNVLELNLYEPRRDRTAKGQLLGTALIDLAEHGMVREAVVISVPVNCKRSFRTTAQPLLYVKIQPLNKDDGNSSSKESSSKEVVLDKDSKESVSALMNEEYAEEAEVASFTDDDVSSHSSLTNGSSPLETNADLPVQGSPREVESSKDMSEVVRESREADNVGAVLPLESVPPKPELKKETTSFHLGGTVNPNGSLPQASLIETSVDSEILDADASLSEFPPKSLTLCSEKSDNLSMDSSSSTVTSEAMEEEIVSVRSKEDVDGNDTIQEVEEDMEHDRTDENVARNSLREEIDICGMANQVGSLDDLQNEKSNLGSIAEAEQNVDKDEKSQESGNELEEVARGITSHQLLVDETLNGPEEKVEEIGGNPDKIECITENLSSKLPITAAASLKHTPSLQQQSYLQSDLKTSYRTMSSRRFRGENSNRTLINDRLKNLKFSAMLPSDSFGNIASANCDLDMEEVKEIDVQEDVHNDSKNFVTDDGIDDHESTRSNLDKVKHISGNRKESISDKKVQELEVRLEMLEGELREAAAIEIGLYLVVAEHGSSVQKVHTPARRISRYWSRDRRASAARSAVSGLVMAAKACGNDVPRLTFWLSNCVVLRAIVTQAIKNQNIPVSGGPYAAPNGTQIALKNRSSQLKWESSVHKKEEFSFSEEYEDWEDPYTFAAALKKIEAWIFSRLVESVWWQALTPHMQSPSEGAEPKKDQHRMITYGRTPSLGDQQRANLSIEIWKKAFKDACERLCPVRAGGHECGCLPMLSRLVMEQCIVRLDVAMFNAILRESDDEIPTDPVSDPISDSKVLPIPSGKSSFGAGAQLKNAIGNWSRWLTDLFGMDTDDSPRGNNEQEENRLEFAGSFKSFHLLNALSDLLMLPKDMLLDSSIRKEVCPTFNASMIKHILESFQPDEFCPDPIPDVVFDALDSEDPLERTEEGIRNFPCNASSIIYSPPPLALIETIIGDVQSVSSLRRSGSSVVRKCHTSDDELDELESPLTSIVMKAYTPNGKPNGNSCGMAVRYKLLREVWRDGN